MKNLLIITLMSFLLTDYTYGQDWADLKRYSAENKILQKTSAKDRVVFMGNSITEGWQEISYLFRNNPNFINRGISGQTSPQMLLRFRQDVIDLDPAVVVILAGTNDIAGNTGPATNEMIMNNIKCMAELAKAHNIEVILCSVLPVFDFFWNPGQNPATRIPELNDLIKSYAAQNNLHYADYFSAMKDEKNGLQTVYSEDGVHPNAKGYEVMESIIFPIIENLLGSE
jgi:lysophospholipase L1-like esterase